MRRNQRIGRIAAAAALAAALLTACRTDMAPAERGSIGAAQSVLVAGERSDFKVKVIAATVEELGTRDWHFRVVGLGRLEDQDLGQYGAILLVSTMMGGKLGGGVRRFLDADPGNPKVVLFFTRGGEGPIPEQWGLGPQVDAVSSASRDDRVEGTARELAVLLRARF